MGAAFDNRTMIRLIVGLGNPGPEYAATRHNAGFWFVDEARRRLGARCRPSAAIRALRAHQPAGGPLWLLEPMTFMNLSGKSVAALARFFKIEPAEILVVHDELDLMPGQAKLKLGGAHAGHNGLKDIEAQIGSAGYWRLRLGIGHPGVKAEVVDYVLRKPKPDQRDAIQKAIEQALGGARPRARRRNGARDDEDPRAAAEAQARASRGEADRRAGPTRRPPCTPLRCRRRSPSLVVSRAPRRTGADRLPVRQRVHPRPVRRARQRDRRRRPPHRGPACRSAGRSAGAREAASPTRWSATARARSRARAGARRASAPPRPRRGAPPGAEEAEPKKKRRSRDDGRDFVAGVPKVRKTPG